MKLLWHSNAPWTPTGYGQQTAVFAPYLNEYCEEFGISSFYGLEGAPLRWEGIPVLAGLGGEYGNGTLPQHANGFFGGARNGIVITLMDVWVLDASLGHDLNLACWTPVDHEPVPTKVTGFLAESEAVPIAMTRFGEEELSHLDPLYLPHAIDTTVYRPLPAEAMRAQAFPKDAFVVGMVAANKGRPSRKSFAPALQAFTRFAEKHENVFLYLHTMLDPTHSAGENLPGLLRALGVPDERVRVADQYTLMHNPYSPQDMARIYSAMDVLLNPSMGEGFGIPVVEAAACGIPAVVTDFTAMREVCGAGWHVGYQRYWSALGSWQAFPNIQDIEDALEECYSLKSGARGKLASAARKHALGYEVQTVAKRHLLPTLKEIERRFAAREPVMIAPRKVAA